MTWLTVWLPACGPTSDEAGAPIAAGAADPAALTAEPIPGTVVEAAENISAAELARTVEALADDAMEGRGPATPGDRAARRWIAEALGKAGFSPGAADGSWEQPFEVVGVTSTAPAVWTFEAAGEAVEMRWSEDYIATSGVQEPASRLTDAEVVFVGYGIEAPEHRWDDFKGADLSGKVLLMLNNDPDWDPELFEGDRRLYYGRWTYKYEIAAAEGAAGAIIIHTTPSAGYPWQVVQSSWSGEQFYLPAAGEPTIEVAGWLTHEAAERLVAAIGLDLMDLEESARSRDFEPVPLGITTSLELRNRVEKAETANVIGVLEGRDPRLASEAVVFTAHHDHLGVGEPDAEGDRIYNGARDNAAGVAQVLAIARAYASLEERPRRSVVALLVGAEEQGLLGSKHYARQPTIPPGEIAANINFDAPGIWGPTRDLPLIGRGKSTLDEVASRVATLRGREVVSEADPTQGSFYRSDQLSFAEIGVPALYFGEGEDFLGEGVDPEAQKVWNETRYHQQSDEYEESWNLEGAAEDARAGFLAGWLVATADELPAWLPGDEFEAARKEALAAVE